MTTDNTTPNQSKPKMLDLSIFFYEEIYNEWSRLDDLYKRTWLWQDSYFMDADEYQKYHGLSELVDFLGYDNE